MLRFRRDRLHIGFEPDRLAIVRLAPSTWKRDSVPTVVDYQTVPLGEGASQNELIDQLTQTLGATRWRKATAQVVLSDRFVRYFVADCPPGARNLDEIKLTAGLRFEDIFGTSADEWDIRLDTPVRATRHLACSLRKTFLTQLVTACGKTGLPVTSVQPFAISEFNRVHANVSHQDGWFVVPERNSLWVAQKKGVEWLSARQHPLTGDDLVSACFGILAQESLRSAYSSPQIYLSGLLTDADIRQRLSAHPVQLLDASAWPGQSPSWSDTYRIALSSMWPACA